MRTGALIAAPWIVLAALVGAAGCGHRERVSSVPPPRPLSRFEIQDIGPIGEESGGVAGISDRGDVTGQRGITDDMTAAFTWRSGPITDLGTLGGKSSWARAVNGSGEVVGGADTTRGVPNAFRFRSHRMRSLGTLGGDKSGAWDINERGDIVGQAQTSSGENHAFLWRRNAGGNGGRMRDLGTRVGQESAARAINERGQIVGVAQNNNGALHAFLWEPGARPEDPGTITDLGPGEALDINESGQVVVSDGLKPFLWENGKRTRLPPLSSGQIARASALNDAGQIVGACTITRSVIRRAVLWHNGRAYDLNWLVPADEKRLLTEAGDINARGQIVCRGLVGDEPHAFLLTPAGQEAGKSGSGEKTGPP